MSSVLIQKYFPSYRINLRNGVFVATMGAGRGHLQQGDLDGACGIYCVVMGLIACGAVTVREGNNIATTRNRILKDFWQNVAPFFFAGSRGLDLAPLLSQSFLNLHIRHITLAPRSMIDRIVDAIGKRVFMMIRIANWEADYDHWVVLSGVEGVQERRRFSPHALLLVDPAFPSPSYRLYNGILQIERGRRPHRYFQDGEKRDVYVLEALSFDPRRNV
jgi:hypothetical protein